MEAYAEIAFSPRDNNYVLMSLMAHILTFYITNYYTTLNNIKIKH